MDKADRLERVLKQWEAKADDFFKESMIARKHNYNLEAVLLDAKYVLVRDFCRELRMKVVEELIDP